MLEFSSKVTDKTLFELDLSKINQCVVPTNNAQDLELQFGDAKLEKNADCLVSITFHFPTPEEKEGEDGENEEIVETDAQKLKSQIMAAGLLKSSTGDVVIEFTKDEGNFTFPRGKYALQVSMKSLRSGCRVWMFLHMFIFRPITVHFQATGYARWTIFLQN